MPGSNPGLSYTQPRDAQLGPWLLFAVGILLILGACCANRPRSADTWQAIR